MYHYSANLNSWDRGWRVWERCSIVCTTSDTVIIITALVKKSYETCPISRHGVFFYLCFQNKLPLRTTSRPCRNRGVWYSSISQSSSVCNKTRLWTNWPCYTIHHIWDLNCHCCCRLRKNALNNIYSVAWSLGRLQNSRIFCERARSSNERSGTNVKTERKTGKRWKDRTRLQKIRLFCSLVSKL